jgi:hypothetical protein
MCPLVKIKKGVEGTPPQLGITLGYTSPLPSKERVANLANWDWHCTL